MPGVDVARVLRQARDLMNTNGRHWIKGDMKLVVDEQLKETYSYLSPKAQVGDSVYCTWGGIREIADTDELRVEAMEALVQVIDDYGWDSYLQFEDELRYEYEDELNYSGPEGEFARRYPTFGHYWNARLGEREDSLGDIIATWNDADTRTWEDVRDSLSRAAANAKKTTVTTGATLF